MSTFSLPKHISYSKKDTSDFEGLLKITDLTLKSRALIVRSFYTAERRLCIQLSSSNIDELSLSLSFSIISPTL